MLIKNLKLISLTVIVLFGSVGCSTKNGTTSLSSDYVYPNSNVTPMQKVQASETYYSWIIPPSFEKEDYYEVKEKAMKQAPDADLMLNYSVDVETTQWLPLPYIGIISPYHMTVTATGTAAKMEVGKKELK